MDIISEHFRRSEFQCACPCKADHIQPVFIAHLEDARRKYGGPMMITSGVRCPEHNAKVGGVPDSAHVTGWAADIACTTSDQRFKLINALLSAGFKRIGVASNFVHCDLDPSKPENLMWTY